MLCRPMGSLETLSTDSALEAKSPLNVANTTFAHLPSKFFQDLGNLAERAGVNEGYISAILPGFFFFFT